MALLVWYMFTAAVVTCGIIPAAIFVHTILPVARLVALTAQIIFYTVVPAHAMCCMA